MNFGFKAMQAAIREKVERHEQGLYVVLIFPIAFASLLTFTIARGISSIDPGLGFWPTENLHVHHFTYGVFILAASGYLALVFSGPRAKFLIALLLGFGLGLSFDEFGMWLYLRGDDVARWQYDGIIIVLTFFFLVGTLKSGTKFLWRHVPFTNKTLANEHTIVENAGKSVSNENIHI